MSAPAPGSQVTVVGAGLAGSLLALPLAKRGHRVRVLERRADPRLAGTGGGRSINLALADRGIAALRRAGVLEAIAPLLIPMRGRMIHDVDGSTSLQRYGQSEREVIYSVSRGALNLALIEQLSALPGVELRFGQACLGARPAYGSLQMQDAISGEGYDMSLLPTIATDGAGSAVRASLQAAGELQAREEFLDHDYKELNIPPPQGAKLDRHALHIWPRRGFMLIGLPNPDGSFTATLFLARTGTEGFASLSSPAAIQAFFEKHFRDVLPLMPELLSDFSSNPQGILGTVHCAPWQAGGQVLLLGDASHAIVPFHGQGMNCAFEDCTALLDLLPGSRSWAEAFTAFERLRQPNAAAIAQMALENYREMRESVLDAGFLRQRELALALERRHPSRFIPRYSMVMFHAGIPYAEALRRGEIQQQLLARIDAAGLRADARDLDSALAAYDDEIRQRLPPVNPVPADARA